MRTRPSIRVTLRAVNRLMDAFRRRRRNDPPSFSATALSDDVRHSWSGAFFDAMKIVAVGGGKS
jgi:hypothetical protein